MRGGDESRREIEEIEIGLSPTNTNSTFATSFSLLSPFSFLLFFFSSFLLFFSNRLEPRDKQFLNGFKRTSLLLLKRSIMI